MADRCKQSRPYGWVGGVYIGYSPERITVKSQGAPVDYVPERETCRNVYNECEMGACDNGFECSVCGNRVEDYEHYAVTGEFNYCSKCGRKVER